MVKTSEKVAPQDGNLRMADLKFRALTEGAGEEASEELMRLLKESKSVRYYEVTISDLVSFILFL